MLLISDNTRDSHPTTKNDLDQNAKSANLNQWFSNYSVHQDYMESLLDPTFLGPSLRVSVSVGLGKDPRTCISNKFLGNAAKADLGTL